MSKGNYQKMKGQKMPALIFRYESQYLPSPLSMATHIFNNFFLSFRQQKIQSGHTVSTAIYKTWSALINGMFRIGVSNYRTPEHTRTLVI